jgi:Reverse transcriptase (RNA-dependent DNA polymerase)
MPFGLSTAPFICTNLLSVVAFALRTEAGVALVRYLDDILFVDQTAAASHSSLAQSKDIIPSFGLIINPAKTEGPTQCISFLGILIDSLSQTLSCTEERVQELRLLLHATQSLRIIKRQKMESLIGKLSFAAQVLPGARPFMRRLQDSTLRVKKRNAPIRITSLVQADIGFWLAHLSDWSGTQQWRASRTSAVHFASDASLHGFGFYIERIPALIDTTDWPTHLLLGNGFSGLYDLTHSKYHDTHRLIAWCELLAVYAAAVTYFPYLRHQSVIFNVDNEGDTHIINRQATRSSVLAGILRALYKLALTYNISISAKHRRGVDNELADFLSRPALHQHNHLSQWPIVCPHSHSLLSSVSVISSLSFVDKESMPQLTSSPVSLSA